jgi:hypothetical protein
MRFCTGFVTECQRFHDPDSEGMLLEVDLGHLAASGRCRITPVNALASNNSGQLLQSGVIATLRLLFARQAKGKRKLVLWGCFANNR